MIDKKAYKDLAHKASYAPLRGLVKYVYPLSGAVYALLGELEKLEAENANLVRANSVLSDQYDMTFRWIPFSEERPPEDVSRYAVHQNGREKFWHPLAPRPTSPPKPAEN